MVAQQQGTGDEEMLNKYRLRHGLRWHREYPTVTLSEVLHALAPWLVALVVLLAYVVVGTLDYAYAMTDEAMRAESHAEFRHQILIDCLNGTATFTGEDGSKVGCYKAESNPS